MSRRACRRGREPRRKPGGDAGGLRHAAKACGQVHDALAFGDGELAEQEEGGTRFGRDPVRIAASGIEIGDLRRPRRPGRNCREEILDLEWAEGLVLAQRHIVQGSLRSHVGCARPEHAACHAQQPLAPRQSRARRGAWPDMSRVNLRYSGRAPRCRRTARSKATRARAQQVDSAGLPARKAAATAWNAEC